MLHYKRKEKITTWQGLTECGHGVNKRKKSPLSTNCRECLKIRDAAQYAAVQTYGAVTRWPELVPVVRTVRSGHKNAKSIQIVTQKVNGCEHGTAPPELLEIAETVAEWISDDPSDPKAIADEAARLIREATLRLCRKARKGAA
jgi:hypothetical protein